MHYVYFKKAFSLHLYVSKHSFKWKNHFQLFLTIFFLKKTLITGFVRVLENLESPGISLWHFPGLESPGKRPLVLESPGNL